MRQKTNQGVAAENRTSKQQESKPGMEGLSRRAFSGVRPASLPSAALASLAVNAQERTDIERTSQPEYSVASVNLAAWG
jgi:hypothetical protein